MLVKLMTDLRYGKLDVRTLVTYRNVAESIIVKGLSVLIGFVTVPLSIQYLSIAEFGIWMTITSLASWFSLVDVSFGNGLRNTLVSLFSTGEQRVARQYVSTMYALSGMVALGLILLILCMNTGASWSAMFHIETDYPTQIDTIITFTLIGFCVQILLKPINAVLLADQRAASVGWISLLINGLTLLFLYIAERTTTPSLLTMAQIFTIAPIIVLGIFSIYLFRGSYEGIAPNVDDVDQSLYRQLFSTGGQFFVLQLISILVFTAGGLFISYYMGSGSVGPYSVVSKYFGLTTMVYGIVITPYWSAFTDAYTRHDKPWIVRTMRQLNWVSAGMVMAVGLMLLVARPALRLWVGPGINVSTQMLIWTALYSVSFIYLSNYNSFVNGVGKIRKLVVVSVIGVVAYIGLIEVLFRYMQFGPVSVVMAGTAWNTTILFVCWLETRKLIRAMPDEFISPEALEEVHTH